jgi:hypothetical protein
MRKAYLMLGAALLSGLVHAFLYQKLGVKQLPLGDYIGLPEVMNGVWYVSLMTVGVGYLSGKGGIFFIIGGYAAYWVLAPLLDLAGQIPPHTDAIPYLRFGLFRPFGIGMLIGGAITGIVLALPLVRSAVRSMQKAAQNRSASR